MKNLLLKMPLKTDAIIVLILLLIFFTFQPVYSQEQKVFLTEEFNSLENWRPLYFPKITRHSRYTVIKEQDGSCLKAESDSSASGIIYRQEFNVYDYPKIRWRWKIDNIYNKGDAGKKSGDDYPIRVYIIFKYDPEKASFVQKIRYGLAKKIYGEYPPQSSLNYIWANRKHAEKIITNPYAGEAKMIILEAGAEKAGQWVTEEADILQDYKKAFGVSAPPVASIAIMNDSDNTGESSVSYIDFIEVYK
jgi:hypothetical protein